MGAYWTADNSQAVQWKCWSVRNSRARPASNRLAQLASNRQQTSERPHRGWTAKVESVTHVYLNQGWVIREFGLNSTRIYV
eukprot:1157311-Pelagomonas_calceolata.AAC.1